MTGEVALRALCKTTSGEEASVRPLSPYARCRRTPVVSYLILKVKPSCTCERGGGALKGAQPSKRPACANMMHETRNS